MQTSMPGLAQRVRRQTIVAEDVLKRYRNMNLFPFRPYRVAVGLRTD